MSAEKIHAQDGDEGARQHETLWEIQSAETDNAIPSAFDRDAGASDCAEFQVVMGCRREWVLCQVDDRNLRSRVDQEGDGTTIDEGEEGGLMPVFPLEGGASYHSFPWLRNWQGGRQFFAA